MITLNPIVRRELLELLRTRKAAAAQLALAAACALLVLVRWPTGGVSDLSGARSLQVLRVFGYGLLAGVIFLVPAYPATALVRERIRGTLALLLNSPMSTVSIYFGKLGAVLGFAAILLIMTAPAAAACYALGGSSAQGGVGLLYLVLAMAAIQLSTLGLLISSRAQSTDSALRTTYAIVLALCVVPLAPYWLLEGEGNELTAVAEWLRCLSPVPAVLQVLGHSSVGSHGLQSGGDTIGRYVLFATLMSLVLVVWTIRILIRNPLDRARPAGTITQDRSKGDRTLRRVFFLFDPQRRSANTGRLINPVMLKEFRTRRFGRSHWTMRLIALSAIMSLALTYIAAAGALGWGPAMIGAALVFLQASLLLLFAPSLAAGLVSSERETGGWLLLRTTPLSPGRILRGKLLSVAWPLLLLMCATVPGYIVMMTIDPELAPQAQRVVICLVTMAIFSILVGAAASSVCKSTAAAMAVSNLVLVGVCIAPLLVWLGRDAPFGHRTVETALQISPIAAALHASETPGFAEYQLLPSNWWIIGSASVVLLAIIMVRVRRLYRPE